MAMAQSDNEGDGSGDELDNANYFGEENDDSNALSNNFSLMHLNNPSGQRDRQQNRGHQVASSGNGGRPSFGLGFRGGDRSE